MNRKGPVNAARKVDLEHLALRLGPEARRDMREPVVSFGSISNRGRAIEATNDAMLKAMDELAAVAASKQAAKDKHQVAKTARAAESIVQAARDEVAAEQRRCSPAVVARKESSRRRAARARSAEGHVASYVCARGAVVELEPRPSVSGRQPVPWGWVGRADGRWVDGGLGSQGSQLGEA